MLAQRRCHGWKAYGFCNTIIALMLDKLQQKLVDPEVLADRNALRQEQDNVDYLLSLLPRQALLSL